MAIGLAARRRSLEDHRRRRARMSRLFLEHLGLDELAGERGVDEDYLSAVVSDSFPGGSEALDARPDPPDHDSNDRRGMEYAERSR